MSDSSRIPPKRVWTTRTLAATVLVVAVVVLFGLTPIFGRESIQHLVSAAGIYGPIVLILVKIAAIVWVPLPGITIYPLAGTLYGFSLGMTYMFVADLIGTTLSFLLARRFGRRIIRWFGGAIALKKVDQLYDKVGRWRGLVAVRLLLPGAGDLINYAAGLTPLPLWQYVIVTSLTNLPLAGLLMSPTAFLDSYRAIIIFYLVAAAAYMLIIFLYMYIRRKTRANASNNQLLDEPKKDESSTGLGRTMT